MKKSKKKIYVAGAGGMLGEAIFNTYFMFGGSVYKHRYF